MSTLGQRGIVGAVVFAALCAGCSTSGGGKKPQDALKEDLLLDPIRTKHRYVMPSDLPQVQLRVAWIDTAWKSKNTDATFAVGVYRPHDGLFRADEAPQPMKSIDELVAALDPYIDRMPVGLIVTADGAVPGAGGAEPPAAFGAFVSALQAALDKEGIGFTFVLPDELHGVR